MCTVSAMHNNLGDMSPWNQNCQTPYMLGRKVTQYTVAI